MPQKRDSEAYRTAIRRKAISDRVSHWDRSHQAFMKNPDTAEIRIALQQHGIKEPYAGNIIERLWHTAYHTLITAEALDKIYNTTKL
jgi:expansin (peptidoglycan-binding protein)